MREPGRDSVVFLGRSVMDEYYRTDHFPAEGEKIPLTPLTTVPGGFSNSAFVLAALGTEVFMAETLGDDVHTDTHRRLMEQAGIRQDFVRIRPGAKNNKALILCSEKSSEKTVFTFRTDPEAMEYTREELSRMAQADGFLSTSAM